MKILNEQIETLLRKHGADLAGFADVSNLPADLTEGLTRAVSIAVKLSPSVVSEISNGPTQRYYAEYCRVNELLGNLCRQTADFLITCGRNAKAIEATTDNFNIQTLSMPVQHKTIATRAGLGWIGKSALLITKEYGPAIRFSSVFTDAELQTGEPVDISYCGDCNRCVELCPAGAIAGVNWSVGAKRESLYDAFACRKKAKNLSYQQGIKSTICGICIHACPWTQKYLKRELTD